MRGPLDLHLKWRLVAQGVTYIAANDRYVLIVENPNNDIASAVVQLLDEQTGTKQPLSPPDCSPDYSNFVEVGNRLGGPMFGGPWLMVTCFPKSPMSLDTYELYNLQSGQWVSFTPSSQCGYSPRLGQGACIAVGVGGNWVKLYTTDGLCEEHCGTFYYLQNIFTGDFKPDPATPGGTTFDDLNSPSGSAPLCPPLRYPQNYDGSLGGLQFSGPFALASANVYSRVEGTITVSHLERCGSHLNLTVPGGSLSSRAVVWTGRREDHCKNPPYGPSCISHFYVGGLYLPGLRQFTAALPKTTVPQYSWPGAVVGLIRQTVYVEAPYPDGSLWAATLPTPRTSGRHH